MKYSMLYEFKVKYGLMTVRKLSRPPENNMEVLEGWTQLIFEDDEKFARWLTGHYQKCENKVITIGLCVTWKIFMNGRSSSCYVTLKNIWSPIDMLLLHRVLL